MPQPPLNVFQPCRAIPKIRTLTHVRCRPKTSAPLSHARGFTTSRPTHAAVPRAIPRNIMKHMPPQQSMRSRMKTVETKDIPNDLGLMPETLIRPPNRELPSFISRDWRKRLRIEWLWTKTRFQNFFSIYYYLRWNAPRVPGTRKKAKRPYEFVNRTVEARHLHEEYYTALAQGNIALIQRIACKGLVQQSQLNISQRGNGAIQNFSILAYHGFNYPKFLGWPFLSILPRRAFRIMSDKVTPLPFGQNNLLRQVVVRIRSFQKLERLWDESEAPLKADVTEYVVLQRMIMDGVDQKWKIWGTTKPSTMEQIDQMLGGTSNTASVVDRLREQTAKLTGM